MEEVHKKYLIEGDDIPSEWKIGFLRALQMKGNNIFFNYIGIKVTSYMEDCMVDSFQDFKEIDEQFGFREGSSLQQLIEKGNESEYLSRFVDLEKVCDKVPINNIFEILQKTIINKSYVRAKKKLYRNSKCCLKQGCCFTPTLFEICIQKALSP